MRITVTGSNGTIGKALVAELLKRGHDVFGLDLTHNEHECGFHFGMGGSYARCDVSDYRQIERALEQTKPQIVYHAAAEFGRWNGEDFYEQLWRTNVIGTKHVLRLQQSRRFRLVHFSSSEVYGDCPSPMRESNPPVPLLNDYAMTKWVNEQQIANAGTESVIVRLFNTYGPGEYYSPYRSVNCRFLYAAMKGLPLKVYQGHRRTSTFVGDTVRTLANIVSNFVPGAVYNIASTNQHTIEELAQIALECMKSTTAVHVVEHTETATTIEKHPDVSRAVNEIGHRCEVSLKDGMQLTADWMRKAYA